MQDVSRFKTDISRCKMFSIHIHDSWAYALFHYHGRTAHTLSNQVEDLTGLIARTASKLVSSKDELNLFLHLTDQFNVSTIWLNHKRYAVHRKYIFILYILESDDNLFVFVEICEVYDSFKPFFIKVLVQHNQKSKNY